MMKKWRCSACGYVYDPADGDVDHGVSAGTPFESLPEDWVCPVCGVGQDQFEPVQDPKALQQAIFKISYGLFIVTSFKNQRLNGQTANTVFQITSDPISVAVGINKSNLTHEFIMDSGVLGITILGQDDHDLVKRFGYSSGRDKNKFEDMHYSTGVTGVPLVNGGVAQLEGKMVREKCVDMGTHTLFIVDIVDGTVVQDSEPMTYAYFRKTK